MKNINRLEYLSKMLLKYKHTWSETPSNRMLQWVNEYNKIKDEDKRSWEKILLKK